MGLYGMVLKNRFDGFPHSCASGETGYLGGSEARQQEGEQAEPDGVYPRVTQR